MAFSYSYSNFGGSGDRTTGTLPGSLARMVVTSTLTINGGGAFSNLCDGGFGNNTSDSFKVTSVAASGKEIKFDLTNMGARVITEFKFYQDTSDTHGVWDFKGSLDDSTYVTLQSGITLGGSTTQTQTVANTSKYLFYKFVGVSGNTNATPFWQEFEFKISGNALIELGDRTATATVTFSGTVPSGTASNWIDGGFNNSSADSASFQAVTAVGKTLKFDMGSGNSARVTGFTWWQQTADTHGTFDFEGSNDNSSWTSLRTGFTLGGATRTRYSITNTTAYRYYRLSGTAGTLSATPWLWEWEFEEEAVPPTGATGTWASTEATDTFAGAGGLLGGSWASTEAHDTFAGAGYPKLTGTMAVTEAKDVFAGAGGNLGGAWVSTEAHDTFAGAGGLLGGSWASTEAHDTFAGAGYPKLTGTWASTESPDTVAFQVNFCPYGSLVVTEPHDTFAGAGAPNCNAAWASIEAKDTINFQVKFCPYGAWISTEAADVFAGIGAGQVIGTLAATEAKDVFAGTVAPNALAAWASTEAHDTWAGTGYPKLRGTMAITEAKDTFHATGAPLLSGTWESTEVKDHFAGVGHPSSIGTWASIEAADMFSVSGGPPADLGIDAHVTASSHDSAFCSATITTLYVDDVIVVAVCAGGFWSRAKVGSITDTAGLVWKKRHQRWQVGSNPSSELWWARKPSAGPTTITVHTVSAAGDPVGLIQVGNTTGFLCLDVLAIKGANPTRPWDTHTGAGWFTDSFGSGNPTGNLYSNSTKGMALAFYGSSGVDSSGTVTAGWTWLERATAVESAGQTGRLESAYKVFNGAQLFTDHIVFGQVGGASNSRAIMQDVIVSKKEPDLSHNATDDVIRWYFDGHGNQTVLQMSGSNNSATQTFQTFNPNSVAVVAVMIESAQGARVDHITDDGNHSGWARRSIVANDIGSKSFEVWWCQFPTAFSGNITVVADSNIAAGDIIGFTATGINGPDATLRGEIWDGDSSLPNTLDADDVSGLFPQTGPFSTLNNNVLELNFVANTGSATYSGDPTGFQQPPWLQYIGDYFSSVGGELVSSAPAYNIATDFKFSAEAVNNESVETDVSPLPAMWFMIADAMPVGPPSPPTGTWHSTETADHTSNSGAFTAIGLNTNGWVGFVPATATMAATDTPDRTTNSGAFTAIWNANGWIGYVPLHYSFAITEHPDIMLAHAWVIGATTILATWASTEAKDRFAASSTCLYSSYTTADSTGDRTARITATTNATLTSGTVDNLVDGLKANGAGSAISVAISQPAAMYFRFEFLQPTRVTEAKWYQNGVSAQPGLWKWQGSDDGLVWDDLSATFTLNAGNTGAAIGSLPNCAFYKFWQIIQTTNAGGNDTPQLWEIEFKCDGIQAVMAVTEFKDRAGFQGQVIPTATPLPARKRRLLIVT